MLRLLDLRPRAILVRRFPKHRFEQPNEMKARKTGRSRDRSNREGLILPIPQKVTRAAKTAEKFRVNHFSDYIA